MQPLVEFFLSASNTTEDPRLLNLEADLAPNIQYSSMRRPLLASSPLTRERSLVLSSSGRRCLEAQSFVLLAFIPTNAIYTLIPQPGRQLRHLICWWTQMKFVVLLRHRAEHGATHQTLINAFDEISLGGAVLLNDLQCMEYVGNQRSDIPAQYNRIQPTRAHRLRQGEYTGMQ
uniref:Uncharacterized protein n=1 Tax=Mycena chlorophos TaxID=658473 RepID=A0ABQ0KXX6_MYCCL|nr:predicted protein [Mycena chlorophos]